jgi:hypothetical protein
LLSRTHKQSGRSGLNLDPDQRYFNIAGPDVLVAGDGSANRRHESNPGEPKIHRNSRDV